MSRQKLRVVSTFQQWLAATMRSEKLSAKEVSILLGVTPKSVHEWLRGKGPLHPSHVKAELVQRLDETKKKSGESVERLTRQLETPFRELFNLLLPNVDVGRLADLPPSYRERYRTRVGEVTLWVKRELEEFLRVLETEVRAARKKET
jgi:predicted transcriptional regulator